MTEGETGGRETRVKQRRGATSALIVDRVYVCVCVNMTRQHTDKLGWNKVTFGSFHVTQTHRHTHIHTRTASQPYREHFKHILHHKHVLEIESTGFTPPNLTGTPSQI
jgi:hypothetical protein